MPNLLRQVHAAQEGLEARGVAQIFERRHCIDKERVPIAHFETFLDPGSPRLHLESRRRGALIRKAIRARWMGNAGAEDSQGTFKAGLET